MELNKEYTVTGKINDIIYQVNEFITLIEKFKTFNINKNYTIEINKEQELYYAKMIIRDEKQDNKEQSN